MFKIGSIQTHKKCWQTLKIGSYLYKIMQAGRILCVATVLHLSSQMSENKKSVNMKLGEFGK